MLAPNDGSSGTKMKYDFVRAEGLYVGFVEMQGIEKRYLPVQIERVCGDASVRDLTIAQDEARGLIGQLKDLLKV